MRFANPPGIASFLQKNAGYDEIGGRAIRDVTEQDLEAMNSIGRAQQTGLATIARDNAADLRREAEMYGSQEALQNSFLTTAINAAGNFGSMGIESALSGSGNVTPTPTPPRTMPDAPTQSGLGLHINGRDLGIGYSDVG